MIIIRPIGMTTDHLQEIYANNAVFRAASRLF
jgi:hypothetical protein